MIIVMNREKIFRVVVGDLDWLIHPSSIGMPITYLVLASPRGTAGGAALTLTGASSRLGGSWGAHSRTEKASVGVSWESALSGNVGRLPDD